MSVRNLLWFYRRRLRARAVQEVLALVGIAVGVALLFAVQVSNRSLSASISQLTHGLVGDAQLQLVARGPQGFDERVAERAQRSAGVRAVAPMLVAQGNVVSGRGSRSVYLLAADRRLADLGGALLTGYRSASLERLHAVVLPLSLARTLGVRFGDTVTLQIAGRPVPVTVGAIVTSRDVGPLADSPVLFTSLAYAQELTGMRNRISRLYVAAEPGRAQLARASLERIAAGRLTVAGTDYDRRLFAQAAMPNDQSTALFAGISALVGFLLAVNAMLLMARERRALISELRLSGYGAAAVAQVLLLDALLLGIAASIVGVALGDQLSRHVFEPSPGYLAIAFPVGSARTVTADIVLLAFATGILAAILATLSSLLAAFRAPTMDTLESSPLDAALHVQRLRRRVYRAIGIAALAGAVAVTVVAPEAAVLGVVALVVSMLALLPTLLSGTLRALDRLRRGVVSVVPPIAVGELQSSGSRSVAIAAIACIAVFGSTAIESAHRDLQSALDTASHELSAVTDLWVSPSGQANALATTPFPPTALRQIARTQHVASVAIYRGGLLDLGDRRVWVMAPPRGSAGLLPADELVDGDLGEARARLNTGGWAAMSEVLARERHLSIGDAFTLAAPRPMRFRLAAVTTNFGWSPGALILNADDFARAWASDDASALQVRLDGAVSRVAGKRLVQHALGLGSALTVETVRQREQRHRATTRAGLARLTQIAVLVLISAALAIGAAMGGMIWQRRRRMADLKLAGVNHRQVWSALVLESSLLLLVGCLVGALYGIFGAQLLDRALGAVTGFPVVQTVGVDVALGSFALVGLVASLVVLLPGYLAARVPVEAAFQD